MEFHGANSVLTVLDEPTYSPGSADNLRRFDREYSFAGDCRPASIYSVSCEGSTQPASCVLLGGGGATRVHQNSVAIIEDRCFVAIGDTICLLTLPSLDLLWTRRVDTATCFGVYYLPEHRCLISHGEVEIARLSLAGEIMWSEGGRDIFSEGFRIEGNRIEAVDFNRYVYRFDVATGRNWSMSEQDWPTCTDPTAMLEFVRGKASERKLRLFAVACFQRVKRLLPEKGQQRAIEVLEEMAEGEATTEVRRDAATEARRWIPADNERYHAAETDDPHFVALMLYREFASSSIGHHAAHVSSGLVDGAEEQQEQGRIIRCIVGNPFSPVTTDPSWRTPTVKQLAQAIYTDRAFDRLPILADALEEAGCTDADILAHCRQPGVHVRGCWALDLVLGKE